ncbi:hypothetical protein KM043_013758 [Ampulex compressa]|nr:hypothetical protein KM043_013758 [Ampulex compressa]
MKAESEGTSFGTCRENLHGHKIITGRQCDVVGSISGRRWKTGMAAWKAREEGTKKRRTRRGKRDAGVGHFIKSPGAGWWRGGGVQLRGVRLRLLTENS